MQGEEYKYIRAKIRDIIEQSQKAQESEMNGYAVPERVSRQFQPFIDDAEKCQLFVKS